MIGTQVTSENEQGTSLGNTDRALETLKSTISDETVKAAGLRTMGLAHLTSLRADPAKRLQMYKERILLTGKDSLPNAVQVRTWARPVSNRRPDPRERPTHSVQ